MVCDVAFWIWLTDILQVKTLDLVVREKVFASR